MNRIRKRSTFTLSLEALDLLSKTAPNNKSAYIEALIRKNGESVHTKAQSVHTPTATIEKSVHTPKELNIDEILSKTATID